MKSCAFTGHRPERFFFKQNEKHPLCEKIKAALFEQSTALYDKGVKRFYIGGAQGVDIWAGEVIIKMKKLPEYQDIELICVIPFEGHDSDWDEGIYDRFLKICSVCNEIKIISPSVDPKAFIKRNKYMVDNSDYVIAVYDKKRKLRSGTGQTVNYAKKFKRDIIFIHPETAEISY